MCLHVCGMEAARPCRLRLRLNATLARANDGMAAWPKAPVYPSTIGTIAIKVCSFSICCTYLSIYIYTCVCMYECVWVVYVHVYAHIHVYVYHVMYCMYMCIRRMYVSLYMYKSMCVYTCVCMPFTVLQLTP
jgi:hypothetical protein